MAKVEHQPDDWKPELSRKQSDAFWLLAKAYVRELLFGGAKGGGKSVFGCFWLYAECYEIARLYVPKPLKHPIPIAFMGRKVAKHFKETTLDTWKRFIPPNRYTIKGDPAEIVIADRVLIRTGGLEAKEDLEKFNSAEFCRIFIDQAEETSLDDISVLRASLRLVINEQRIPSKVLWTANPAQCWLKEAFLDHPTAEMPFVRSLPSDNKWTGESYIKTLELAFGHRPELLAAYKDGSWEEFEGGDQIILLRWLLSARENEQEVFMGKRLIACDPARFGDDETVIMLMDGTEIKEKETLGKCKTTDISRRIKRLSYLNDKIPAIVDEIGIGAGVCDELTDLGVSVIPFCSSAKASQPDKYYNLRAEAWMTAGEKFSKREIHLSNCDSKLQNQLTVPRYSFRGERVLVESKEDIKKRLGNSPDEADCYIMGLWGLNQIESYSGGVTKAQIKAWHDKYKRTG